MGRRRGDKGKVENGEEEVEEGGGDVEPLASNILLLMLG